MASTVLNWVISLKIFDETGFITCPVGLDLSGWKSHGSVWQRVSGSLILRQFLHFMSGNKPIKHLSNTLICYMFNSPSCGESVIVFHLPCRLYVLLGSPPSKHGTWTDGAQASCRDTQDREAETEEETERRWTEGVCDLSAAVWLLDRVLLL